MVKKYNIIVIPFCSWYTIVTRYKTKNRANKLIYTDDIARKIDWLQVLQIIDTVVYQLFSVSFSVGTTRTSRWINIY